MSCGVTWLQLLAAQGTPHPSRRSRTMRICTTDPLFPWDALEDSPSLKTLRCFLDAVPDGKLLDGLRQARGKGRNDHPVAVLWGVVLLTIVLRHVTFEAC